MIRPVKVQTKVTTPFLQHPYPYSSLKYHTGVDYGGEEGRTVYSPVSGTVTQSYESTLIGNTIEIREDGNGRLHRLMHLKTKKPKAGDKLKEGQVIATTGGKKGASYSGSVSQGPHLHWDVRKAGTEWDDSIKNYYDPEKLISPVKEDDMLSKGGLDVLVRMYCGRSPSDQEYKDYVGKVTFDKMRDNVRTWGTFETAVENAKASKLNPANHLPSEIRDVFKPQGYQEVPGPLYKKV